MPSKMLGKPKVSELESLASLEGQQPEPKLLDQEPLSGLIERAVAAASKGKFAVFAYGSLIWHPNFRPAFELPARVYGFSRQPCVRSTTYRGTAAKPGLVFGLDTGGSCQGMALGLPKQDRIKIIKMLFLRECFQGVYWPRIVSAHIQGSDEPLDCLTFTVNHRSPSYAPPMAKAKVAKIVHSARGKSGPCIDYWRSSIDSFVKHGINWNCGFDL